MNSNIKIIENYRDNENLRKEYFIFLSKVFPRANFVEWYQKGFWTKNYIPFSIIQSNKIVSNVSATFMDIVIKGKNYKAIQLGAVGTIPEYRNQGLSRIMMDYVLNKYKGEVDLFLLFANNEVLKFYPRFGFRNINEKVFSSNSVLSNKKYSARKLNIKDQEDYHLLLDLLKERNILTKILGCRNYGFITMWHVLNYYANNLFYLKEEDAIVIKTENDETLHILDIIYRKLFNVQTALSKVVESDRIDIIQYYFPPDQLKYGYDKIENDSSYLFIRGEIELEGELLKFPETAHT